MSFPKALPINTRYTHSGNPFSRAFFIAQGCASEKKLVIVDSDRDMAAFQKTYAFVSGSPARIVHDLVSLLEMITTSSGCFLAHRTLIERPFDVSYLLAQYCSPLVRNMELSMDMTIDLLIEYDYAYSSHLSKPHTYTKDGDTVSIRIDDNKAVILSFFDTLLDEILLRDERTGELKKMDSYTLVSKSTNPIISDVSTRTPDTESDLFSHLRDTLVIYSGLDFFEWLSRACERSPQYIVFSENLGTGMDLCVADAKISSIDDLETIVRQHGDRVHLYTKHRKAIDNFLEYNGLSVASIRETSATGLESFVCEETSIAPLRRGDPAMAGGGLQDPHQNQISKEYHITDDILSNIFIRNRTRKSVAKNLDLLLDMRVGDYIVHRDHGIGIFREITEKNTSGVKREYMAIEYAANDKLFVPLGEIHRVSKYIGEEHPKLTRLSTAEWRKTIEKTNEDVERIANELLTIYAKRRIAPGFSFRSFPAEERSFREAFRYAHTPDQASSILEIFEDMEQDESMDRLLAGDVGFGKTEVAMNAIYKAFLNGKQSAFISPLVVLAYEHDESLRTRFAAFGVRTAVLTRLSSPKEERSILAKLKNGEIDCIVGTHRLLSADIVFRNLGLLIVDEEHRFWVLDKEKISAMKANIDTLSLSATPIPRSLNLSLSGLKKISVLSTPPPLKKAISTLVLRWNEEAIKQAIEREFARGGQVIFLHNRIASIDSVRTRLEKLLGKKTRIVITHGRMSGIELEDRIIDFKEGKYDILLSTTVIENGVNFLNANTIFIDDAERFGLAQLHQLRGRVGRKDREAYCYLVYHSDHLEDDAKRRLLTIVNHSELGAGFEIAMRDLEIRGAGDILGIKQSGKTSDTGLSLYLRLLEEKIAELRTGQKKTPTATIELDLSYSIPDDFFDSDLDKIRFFRSLESMESTEDLDYAYATFRDANETLPESFENLFLLLRARLVLQEYGVLSLKKVGTNYLFDLDESTPVEVVRKFLDLDRGGNFILVTIHKIKVPTKYYAGDRMFLEALLGVA